MKNNIVDALIERFNETKLTDSPIRVAIYTRVSTNHRSQEDSPEHQKMIAEKILKDHPNAILVKTYQDHGLTGTNSYGRPGFNHMLDDIDNKCFDLLLVKNSSRLNRDKEAFQHLLNKLYINGAAVYFVDTGRIYNNRDTSDVLVGSINSTFDELYSLRQSDSGVSHQELRCDNKLIEAKDKSFGYIWDSADKVMRINSEEAPIVTKIFELYVYQGKSFEDIAEILKNEGVFIDRRKNIAPKGDKPEMISIKRPLSSATIANILEDRRYIGIFSINKKWTDFHIGDIIKTKRYTNDKKDWIDIEMPDLRIIDTELFEMAQRIRAVRKTNFLKPGSTHIQDRTKGYHLFSGKIFCPVCGKAFEHDMVGRKRIKSFYRVKRHSDCSNPVNRLYEDDLEAITLEAIRQIISNEENTFDTLEKILSDAVKASTSNEKEIEDLRKKKAACEVAYKNLLSLVESGNVEITDMLTSQLNEKTKCIKDYTERLNRLSLVNSEDKDDKLNKIRSSLAELSKFKTITRDRVKNYIARIEAHPNGDIYIKFMTGQSVMIQYNPHEYSDSDVGEQLIEDVPY